MQYTEEQKTEHKRLFSARKRRQVLLAIPLVAMVILFIVSEGKTAILGIPLKIAGPAFVVIALAAVGFSLYNWRCPACNKYLGKSMSQKFCAGCGVELS